MAVATLADGRAELDARGYSRFADARQNTWLNQAKNRFEDFPFDWPWLKVTLTGAAPLTVADLRRVLSVADTTSQLALERVDPDDLVDFADANLALTGAACAWYLSSETVVSTYPTTAALSVRYLKFSPELSADGDAPLIPLRYRMTWIDLAEVEVLRYGVKDQAAAALMEQAALGRLGEIAGVYAMQSQPANMATLTTSASVDG